MADPGPAGVVSDPADPAGTIALAYERYAPGLVLYVATSFRGRVAPEDVVHETFTRLISEASANRLPVHIRPWLYRVAHNIAVSDLRRPSASASSMDEPGAPEPATRAAEGVFEDRLISIEIQRAFGALPLGGGMALLMVANGYSGREVAKAVGRTDVATRALLWRSRRSLREMLAAAGYGAGQRVPQLAS